MLEGRLVKNRAHFTIDISFQCDSGEVLALSGPSGSGKTTIIRMLAGLEKPDKGRVSNKNQVWFDSELKINVSARKRKVGYVFQEHTLFPHLNIEKNVGYSCRDASRVRELLDTMGILHLGKRKPQQISGGERQRAAIAQALASDPGILLLDEPFSALDMGTRLRLRQELKALKSRLNIPVILVTHDHNEAQFLAEKIVKLPGNYSEMYASTSEKNVSAAGSILHQQSCLVSSQ
jgi:molybdate transport system ATP-binding protein